MRELIQIESPSEHTCAQVSMERWHVLEPISGHWSWMTVFGCCNQIVFEVAEDEAELTKIKRAA